MKRHLLFLLISLSPLFSLGQDSDRSELGFTAGFVFNHPFGSHWYNERVVRLGMSTKPKQFGIAEYGPSLFNSAFQISLLVTGAKKHQHFTGIQTSISDFFGNNYGFGRVEFSRISPSLMYDLGFKFHEESIVNPYATAGMRMDFYYSRFYEELYSSDNLSGGLGVTNSITSTSTLRMGLGLGTKFLFSPLFLIDVRYELYGNWALNTNTHSRLPELDSFNHTNIGIPTYQLRERRFQSGGVFSINMVIFFRNRD